MAADGGTLLPLRNYRSRNHGLFLIPWARGRYFGWIKCRLVWTGAEETPTGLMQFSWNGLSWAELTFFNLKFYPFENEMKVCFMPRFMYSANLNSLKLLLPVLAVTSTATYLIQDSPKLSRSRCYSTLVFRNLNTMMLLKVFCLL